MKSSRPMPLADQRGRGKIGVMAKKQLRLGAFMRPVSIHTAAWRYPGGTPDANFNLKALISYAQTLERGKFDAFFMADHLAVLNMPMEALKRSATVTSFDPLTLLPALAQHTSHLGLIATASTTFEPAYTIARRFASLDHISEGRAGWNIVTTSNPDAAQNLIPMRRRTSAWTTRWSTTSAMRGRASSTTSSPACGIRGPTTPSCATSRAASISIRPSSMC
jgi:alkanesulfonate monooxygenase